MTIQPPLAAPATCSHPLIFKLFAISLWIIAHRKNKFFGHGSDVKKKTIPVMKHLCVVRISIELIYAVVNNGNI